MKNMVPWFKWWAWFFSSPRHIVAYVQEMAMQFYPSAPLAQTDRQGGEFMWHVYHQVIYVEQQIEVMLNPTRQRI
jgi:hypothetical protein